ncbi:MAG: B12-binding domain-containing radical SAM protein [Phycisphaerae bacterium]|nr:B12-binding domain-containing radical SAM protein [Phycisphaerae bacterium]
MHVILVSTYVYPIALGMRYVSAVLKRAGHRVTVLFLNTPPGKPQMELPPGLRDDFVDHCREADVIGVSLMTHSFQRSCHLTQIIREAGLRAPVVWGGTHATVAPRESAEFADYVCVGEGENPMLAFVDALAAGRDPGGTRGFACIRHGRFVQNPAFPLTSDLDTLPFPDYDMEGHWVVQRGRLMEARPELLGGVLQRYRTSSTRGCPYSCSFCNNSTQMRVYRGPGLGKWVRKRSTESVIVELESICARYTQVEAVNLIDDLFLIRSEAEIEEFVEAYRARVNLPIEFDAFPNTITERKIAQLARLPVSLISMGIQSGSPDTLRNLYNRPTHTQTVAKAIDIIARHGLPAEYHYLVANPFESEASRVETLRFAAEHHRGPARIRIFPLQFYPGSVLYDRARTEGVIGERHEEAYRFASAGKGKRHLLTLGYLDIWLMIVLGLRNAGLSAHTAHRAVSFALNPFVRWCLDRRRFASVAFVIYRVGRSLYRNLIVKPILRPIAWLRRRRRPAPAEGTRRIARRRAA